MKPRTYDTTTLGHDDPSGDLTLLHDSFTRTRTYSSGGEIIVAVSICFIAQKPRPPISCRLQL